MKVNDRWVGFAYGDTAPPTLPPTITGADNIIREFTAVADCPACGCLDIHWLAEPRRRPAHDDTPAGRALQMINNSMETISILATHLDRHGNSVSIMQPRHEPEEATVARICKKCSYQWGQK